MKAIRDWQWRINKLRATWEVTENQNGNFQEYKKKSAIV